MVDSPALTFIQIDDNGISERFAIDEQGNKFTGIASAKYPSGRSRETSYKSGRKDGIEKEYDEYGRLAHQDSYRNGVRHGKSIFYQSNGEETRETWVDGVQEGVTVDYCNGRISRTTMYQQSQRHGVSISYHENGMVASLTTYVKGSQEGLYAGYYSNGNVRMKGIYSGGREDGIREEYYESGKLHKRSVFKNGLPDGHWLEYYENGKLQWEGNFKNGKEDGIHLWYYKSNGRFRMRQEYKETKPDGHWFELSWIGPLNWIDWEKIYREGIYQEPTIDSGYSWWTKWSYITGPIVSSKPAKWIGRAFGVILVAGVLYINFLKPFFRWIVSGLD